jgi:tetratricopeptide (TPR) repeat protein
MTREELLHFAAAEHQAGRLQQAEGAYRQLLAAEPNQPIVLALFGVLLHQSGRSPQGEQLMRRSLALAPNAADTHNNLGKLLRETRRPQESVACFRAALRLRPNIPELHHNLGLVMVDLGDQPAAEASFRNALRLNRDMVAARIDLGALLNATGRAAEAEACLRAALRVAPTHPRVHNALGMSLGVLKRYAEALEHFESAIAGAPGYYIEAETNRAATLVSLERFEAAEAAYRAILAIDPEDRVSLVAMGQILVALDRSNETEPFVRTLLRLSPEDPELHFALGGLLARTERHAEAVPYLENAIRLQPDYPRALHGLGIAFYDLGRLDESLPLVERAAALEPEEIDFRTSLGYAYLLRRDYARGWPLFELRTRKKGNPRLAEPVWDGAPTDRTVLVHAEQGVGDSLQFCRFLPLAAQRAPIIVAAPKSCGRLFAQFTTIRSLYTEPPLPDCDVQIPMMSLAHVLGIGESDFATTVPYLHADPEAAAAWRTRLSDLPGLRVGLVWAGNPDYPADVRRSMALTDLAPLRDLAGVSFVSLQKGAPAAQLAGPGWEHVTDIAAGLDDFADTAAALEVLDLVITVDTAVAHLAGAMARPVWMLNRADTDWRWQMSREDSPWYPTMRIFRQSICGDWSDPVARVADALRARAAAQAASPQR